MLFTSTLVAQTGNQMLDGIGETALIVRYLFDGNVKDWSRNNLHGQIDDSGVHFINDDQFGQVLSLTKNSKAFVTIPGEAIAQQESISVTGWIYLRSSENGQFFFDFGNNESHFFVAPRGIETKEAYQVEIASENGNIHLSGQPPLEVDKWNHLAIVIDAPSKSLSTYINGNLVEKVNDINLGWEQLFDSNSSENNLLYIGRSIRSEATSLNAKVHDFRIYRIPLGEKQIAGIYKNALEDDEAVVGTKVELDGDLPMFPKGTPQLYNEYLKSVENIEVETQVGFLPQLPPYVKGIYSKGIKKGNVRVIWPSPKDNTEVLSPRTYTVEGIISGSEIRPKAIVNVKDGKVPATPKRELEVFDLDQVSLNNNVHGQRTKFIENRDKFITKLAQTNPDNFLYMFRNAFGQEQPEGAEPLGVWDSQETKLRGHATGHYLTAVAQAYASTGYNKELQENFSEKMKYMVNVLYQLSQMSGQPIETSGEHVSDPAKVPPGPGKMDFDSDLSVEGIRTDYWNWGKGYLSAYPPDQFIMLEKGATYGTGNTKIWAPYYTLHKILAGLLDIYEVSGNEKALEIAKGVGSWVHTRMSRLTTETLISMWNTYIAGEFGGMNEVMARLYRMSNENKYLELAQAFDNIKVFFGNAEHSHGLAKNVDTFRGLHANQHIPQMMGALEMYRDSNVPEYYRIADNFWNKTINGYMYSIGGVAGARNPANAECFISEPATIYENGLSAGGQNETCATYNMLKLTRNLFLFDQRAELMDYYERGLYNHILASVAEDSPANTYHVPLRPGSVKKFGNPDMEGFTCCNGTALESSTKLQNSIYFRSSDNKALFVNLFVPSTLSWTEKKVTIEQTTDFPNEDQTLLTIRGEGEFDIKVRVPKWATKGFFVKINNKKQMANAVPGSYLSLGGHWKDGDRIELSMPFQFHLDPVMDQENIASLFYGPVLLAAQESGPSKEWRKVILDAKDIGRSIKEKSGKLEFTIDGVDFKPFYETYGRHSVYLDVILK
tara:strand:- start:30767 stop:33778 length:3012 start_codon:yes stop_codon:yes gene_type:complete